jgi:hypothetical protein
VAEQMAHREKQLALVLDATLEKLDAPARAALDCAALLPPDNVPWPWLGALVAQEFPDALRREEGYPDPWAAIQRRLSGLRLLTPGDHEQVARLHRLVSAHLLARMAPDRRVALALPLSACIAVSALLLERTVDHETTYLWMLVPLQEAVLHLRGPEPDGALALAADVAGGVEMEIGRLDRAF